MRQAGDVQTLHQEQPLPKCLQPCMAQAGQMLKGLKYGTGGTLLHPRHLGSPEIFKKKKGGRERTKKAKLKIPLAPGWPLGTKQLVCLQKCFYFGLGGWVI